MLTAAASLELDAMNYLNEWRARKEAGNSAAIHYIVFEFLIMINLEYVQQFAAIFQKISITWWPGEIYRDQN
jgi:hypothetical protein